MADAPYKQAKENTQDPLYWRYRRDQVLNIVNDFFDSHTDTHLTQMLLEKMQKGEEEHGTFTGELKDVQKEINNEIIDLVGWSEVGEWKDEQDNLYQPGD